MEALHHFGRIIQRCTVLLFEMTFCLFHLYDVADIGGVEGGASVVEDAVAEGERLARSGILGAEGRSHLQRLIAEACVDAVGNG